MHVPSTPELRTTCHPVQIAIQMAQKASYSPTRAAFQGEGPRELGDHLAFSPKNDLTKGNKRDPQQQNKSQQRDFFKCCWRKLVVEYGKRRERCKISVMVCKGGR